VARRFAVITEYRDKDIDLPQRKTRLSAGYDLAAATDVVLPPGEVVVVPTGLKAYMEEDEVLLIFIRSSLATKRHIHLANQVGVIDADYRDNPQNEGHILLGLENRGAEPMLIAKGDRVAQAIFTKYLAVDDDAAGGERLGGIGSTGA